MAEAPFKKRRLDTDIPRKNTVEIDGKGCTHEVVWPEGAEEGSLLPPPPRPGPPAREYPFKLDPFQQTAVNALEAGHSVLVAAHTSAGKTVVAEYAFAMALRDNQRVIYTSPLKALSNQKYRELHEAFGDVGLMTGDVTINPNASCLVMTTEIFRSMLYRGSELVREVQLIVYDEIHYLQDKERGVVWEESIILAPKAARFAFLSATIPNAREFAEWIAKVHASPCHVVYTDYRPTPLEHYIFPAGGDGLYLVVDQKARFREDTFQKAIAALNDAAADGGGKGGGCKGKKKGGVQDQKKEESDIHKIVKMIAERNFEPAIVFSFSKAECERLGTQMEDLDLNSEEEKKLVDGVFEGAVDCLSEEDRRLPQITAMLPLLRRGVGVHHSGLLPILKEVIEILFQEGLLKVLFATETFSTGLNMPAKTVVFTNARKFDGGNFRWVSGGEYIQMSGRAGRRGLDDKGVVILMLDSKMEPATAKEMVKGAPDTLRSEFHLQYNMLLNLLRVEGADAQQLMRLSYRQFQAEKALPALQARVEKLEGERAGFVIEQEGKVQEYLALQQQLQKLRSKARSIVMQPRHALPFLQPGRLVQVQLAGAVGQEDAAPAWGAMVNFERVGGGDATDGEAAAAIGKRDKAAYLVDVLVNCTADSAQQNSSRRAVPISAQQGGVPLVVPVSLQELASISSVRIFIPRDLRPPEARARGASALAEVEKRFPNGLPLLDPEEDMRIRDAGFKKVQRKAESIEGLLAKHELAAATDLARRLEALQLKQALAEAVRLAKKEVHAAQSLVLQDDLKARRKVLRRLGYVDADGIVTIKGRVASDITCSGDELVLAEMVFDGQFNELATEQICAVVSCFIWRDKSEASPKVRPDLEAPFAALREVARRVAKVGADCGLGGDPDEYVDSFRCGLMEVVCAWCGGARFADLCKLDDALFEGSLVRAIRRLEELLRQLVAALRGVGDADLAAKFEAGILKIRRDIIFTPSLFLV
eukprot:scaffold14.g1342.t1